MTAAPRLDLATRRLEAGHGPGPPSAEPRLEAAPVAGLPPDDRSGEVLAGTYRVERKIADGGMGSVYQVSHLRLDQRFAVKFLDRRYAGDREGYARFRQEAEIAAGLNHGSIVQVFDFNTDAYGNPYMVMEYVEGVTLEAWMARHAPLGRRDILGIFDPLCHALDIAHRHQIVHRDLKPSNIMVRRVPGGGLAVKLLDFGISKIKHGSDTSMTRDNVVMGTPNYMSPEQASGRTREVDARTDVFALGAILYEALSGRRAFDATGLPQVLHQICYEDPPPLSRVAPDVPEAASRVVARCLAKDPAQRFASTRVLLRALAVAMRPPTREATPTMEPPPPRRSRSRWVPVAWPASLLFTAGLASLATSSARPPAAPVTVAAPAPEAADPAPAPPEDTQPEIDPGAVPPGARLVRAGSSLVQADLAGVGLWLDGEPPKARAALPSASPVTTLYAEPSGADLWVGQGDGTLSHWTLAGKLRRIWSGRPIRGAITGVAAGSGYLAVATAAEIRLLARQNGKVLARFRGGTDQLLLAPGSAPLVVALGGGSVRIYDAGRRRKLGRLPLLGKVREASLRPAPGDAVEIDAVFDHGAARIRRSYRLHRPQPGDPLALELLGEALLPPQTGP